MSRFIAFMRLSEIHIAKNGLRVVDRIALIHIKITLQSKEREAMGDKNPEEVCRGGPYQLPTSSPNLLPSRAGSSHSRHGLSTHHRLEASTFLCHFASERELCGEGTTDPKSCQNQVLTKFWLSHFAILVISLGNDTKQYIVDKLQKYNLS